MYFSAHWCPPCRGFTPVLAEKYKAWKDANENIEIVFISSDRDEASFGDYYNEMPWLALDFSKRDLKVGIFLSVGHLVATPTGTDSQYSVNINRHNSDFDIFMPRNTPKNFWSAP